MSKCYYITIGYITEQWFDATLDFIGGEFQNLKGAWTLTKNLADPSMPKCGLLALNFLQILPATNLL